MNIFSLVFQPTVILICVVAINGCNRSDDDDRITAPNDPSLKISITEDNYQQFLKTAVEAMNIMALEEDSERVATLAQELLEGHNSELLSGQGLTFFSEEILSDRENQLYSCDAGGSLVLPVYNFSGIVTRLGLDFDNCVVDTTLFNGSFSLVRTSSESTDYSYFNFSAMFADDSAFTLDGESSSDTARAGIIVSKSWEDTNYSRTNVMGEVFRQSDLIRRSSVRYTRDLAGESGYVSLADGTVGLVSPFEDNASIVAQFDISAAAEGLGIASVSTTLAFDSDHYIWNTLNPDGYSNFVVPTFPVSDLGSPLTLQGLNGAANFSVESLPRIPKGSEQWNSGELIVTAKDGTYVVMRPSPDDQAMVEIAVNEPSRYFQQEWTSELQVSLPAAIAER